MTFEEAIVYFKNGSPIRRTLWDDQLFLHLEQEYLSINDLTSDLSFLIVVSDLFATDWIHGNYDYMNNSVCWNCECK